MKILPSAIQSKGEIKYQLAQRQAAVFLDYDGTLTPIVARPELAVLSQEMREVLQELAKKYTVGIISGRGREDVERLVQIPGLYFAGSHGFDIKGPGIAMTPPEVDTLLPILQKAYLNLKKETQGIEGCLIENKKYSLAIHYRLTAPKAVPQIEAMVDAIARQEPGLKKTTGKKVFELRANIPWDKGKALDYFLQALKLTGPQVLPFYLGDDDTDEDAFAALQNKGMGILVSEEPRESLAKYSLRNVTEVQNFLGWLSRT